MVWKAHFSKIRAIRHWHTTLSLYFSASMKNLYSYKDTIKFSLAHDGSLKSMERMEGGKLRGSLLPHVPYV